MYGCAVLNISIQKKQENLTEDSVFTKSINKMKRTAKKVKDILENLDWQSEWCHPHKWNTADELRCTTTLEATEFEIDVIEDYIDIVLEECVIEYKHDDYTHDLYQQDKMSFHMLLASYIADYVAWDVIRKSDGELYAPESATFTLVIPTMA
jgi:hypothetical protein